MRKNLADIVEISLLLPSWQVDALENAAANRGLTIGQMVRLLIGDNVEDESFPCNRIGAVYEDLAVQF
jgi:hypothetical protein